MEINLVYQMAVMGKKNTGKEGRECGEGKQRCEASRKQST